MSACGREFTCIQQLKSALASQLGAIFRATVHAHEVGGDACKQKRSSAILMCLDGSKACNMSSKQ